MPCESRPGTPAFSNFRDFEIEKESAGMKARLLNREEMVNPVWLDANDEERKTIDERLPIEAGTVIDNPDAWMLCACGKAVPADDECKQRYDEYLGDPRRKQMLENVRRLRAAQGVKQLDAKSKRWLEYMEATYATELAADAQPAA